MKLALIPAAVAAGVVLWAQSAGTPDASARFYEAIRDNDLPALQGLIRSAGVKTADSRGNTPLLYAAAAGSVEAMALVLKAGSDVNAANAFDATALMWSAGNQEKARLLIEKGANVNARSKLGRTPLMIAAYADGGAAVVRLLLEKHADVKARDSTGMTALELAAYANRFESARMLLKAGADVNAADELGFTPLIDAASNGNHSAALVELLLSRGAKANALTKDEAGGTVKNGPLAIGRLTSLLAAAPFGDFDSIGALLAAGASIGAQDIRGMTPLQLAVATDQANPRVAALLMLNRAALTGATRDGETLADWVRKYRNPQIQGALRLSTAGFAVPDEVYPASGQEPGSPATAVEKSVALLQQVNGGFLAAGGCISCHGQNLTAMAVRAAKDRGVSVNEALEAEQAKATVSVRGSLQQSLLQLVDPLEGLDGMEYTLFQMNADGIPASPATDALVSYIANSQREEGDWTNYGVVRPPLEDGSFTFTAMAIRCLRMYPIPARKAEFDRRVKRAEAWLQEAYPISTPDRAMQLLGVYWAGGKVPMNRVLELEALQSPEGGWSQTPNLPADAYATGLALYALHETVSIAPTEKAYQRGVRYLLRTQMADGSWHVKSRAAKFQPYFESGFPYGGDQWISSAGTAWASIALSYAVTGAK